MNAAGHSLELKEENVWCNIGVSDQREASVRFGIRRGGGDDQLSISGSPAELAQLLQQAVNRLLRLSGQPAFESISPKVVIQVTGGGAYVASKPPGVIVAIEDFDASPHQTVVRVYRDDVEVEDGETVSSAWRLRRLAVE